MTVSINELTAMAAACSPLSNASIQNTLHLDFQGRHFTTCNSSLSVFLILYHASQSKAKKSGAAKLGTHTRRAKQPAQKSQPQSTFSPNLKGELNDLDTESNLNSVVDNVMLVDISSHVSANEHMV